MGIAKVTRKREDLIKKVAGSWKLVKGSSVDYVNAMRKEWSEREKRLGFQKTTTIHI